MKHLKNNLDERQELELLRIEHYGMWFVFWALFAAVLIQVVLGADFAQVGAEFIILMVLCIFTVCSCARHGIWDRYLKPNRTQNVVLSIIAGVCVGIFQGVMLWRNVGFAYPLAWLIVPFAALLTFAITFALMSAAARWTKKRQAQLDAQLQEETEEDEDT